MFSIILALLMKISPGTLVYIETDGAPEYGIVIHGWENEVAGYDYYVAFFGNEVPVGKPIEKPYILRYSESTLTIVNEHAQKD